MSRARMAALAVMCIVATAAEEKVVLLSGYSVEMMQGIGMPLEGNILRQYDTTDPRGSDSGAMRDNLYEGSRITLTHIDLVRGTTRSGQCEKLTLQIAANASQMSVIGTAETSLGLAVGSQARLVFNIPLSQTMGDISYTPQISANGVGDVCLFTLNMRVYAKIETKTSGALTSTVVHPKTADEMWGVVQVLKKQGLQLSRTRSSSPGAVDYKVPGTAHGNLVDLPCIGSSLLSFTVDTQGPTHMLLLAPNGTQYTVSGGSYCQSHPSMCKPLHDMPLAREVLQFDVQCVTGSEVLIFAIGVPGLHAAVRWTDAQTGVHRTSMPSVPPHPEYVTPLPTAPLTLVPASIPINYDNRTEAGGFLVQASTDFVDLLEGFAVPLDLNTLPPFFPEHIDKGGQLKDNIYATHHVRLSHIEVTRGHTIGDARCNNDKVTVVISDKRDGRHVASASTFATLGTPDVSSVEFPGITFHWPQTRELQLNILVPGSKADPAKCHYGLTVRTYLRVTPIVPDAVWNPQVDSRTETALRNVVRKLAIRGLGTHPDLVLAPEGVASFDAAKEGDRASAWAAAVPCSSRREVVFAVTGLKGNSMFSLVHPNGTMYTARTTQSCESWETCTALMSEARAPEPLRVACDVGQTVLVVVINHIPVQMALTWSTVHKSTGMSAAAVALIVSAVVLAMLLAGVALAFMLRSQTKADAGDADDNVFDDLDAESDPEVHELMDGQLQGDGQDHEVVAAVANEAEDAPVPLSV